MDVNKRDYIKLHASKLIGMFMHLMKLYSICTSILQTMSFVSVLSCFKIRKLFR